MCPEQSALRGGHHYSPRAQAGNGGQRGVPRPGAHPGAEEVLVQPALLSRDLARHAGPPPHFPADGQEEEEQAAGLARGGAHRKRHCSWSRDSKKHRMPGSPPPLWPLPPPRRPTPGRSERGPCGPKAQPLTLDFSHTRLACAYGAWTALSGHFRSVPLKGHLLQEVPLPLTWASCPLRLTQPLGVPPTAALTSSLLPLSRV